MKLGKGFITHTTNGEHYIVSTGAADFKGLVKNNETAAFIVECLKKDTTVGEITDKLLARYKGADRAVVENDVSEIVDKLRSIGAIEE